MAVVARRHQEILTITADTAAVADPRPMLCAGLSS
ncbi:hypothetical protein [Caudoviricetes sp.]|nr:hypothetical protein [Caudoviricetes sp.]